MSNKGNFTTKAMLAEINKLYKSIDNQKEQIIRNREKKLNWLIEAKKAQEEGNTEKKDSLIKSIENMMNSDDPHNKSITKSIKKIETIMSSLKYARNLHDLPDAPTKPIHKTKKRAGGKT